MNILMISSDLSLFDPSSRVYARTKEQATLVDRLIVIVFSLRGNEKARMITEGNLSIYPTQSLVSIFKISDAFVLGRRLIGKDGALFVITAQDPFWTGTSGYLIALLSRSALHLQLHTDIFSPFWRKESWRRLFEYPLALFLLSRADAVRVVSLRLARGVRTLGIPDERVTILPIPTDITLLKKRPSSVDLHRAYPEFEKIVLSMGRLTREKDYRTLIKAFALLHHVRTDVGLIIVGHGPESDNLHFLARSFGVEKKIKFLPWARDVAGYYQSVDVYVQSSLYEGWGLAVIEALALGTPVIMTDVGCAGEIVLDGESGLVVSPKDEESLAEAMLWMLAHPKEARNLAGQGKERVEQLATNSDALKYYKESWMIAKKHHDT